MPAVTALIPTWNRAPAVARLIGRLKEQTRPPDHILVVDDGSTDGAGETARRLGAEVLRLPRNLGFAAAVNRGLAAVGADWVAVINNDVEPERDWLEHLYQALSQPDVWFATGKLLSAGNPRLLDGSFDLPCRGGVAWRAGCGRPDAAEWNRPRRVRCAPWTAVLLRMELFERVGFLDETFGSYLEDVDFGIRCALGGWEGVYEPRAVALHQGSGTLGAHSPAAVRWIARNQVLLAAKYRLSNPWPAVVAQTLWALLALRSGAGLACLRGKWEGWRVSRSIAPWPEQTARLEALFLDSERELREIQSRTGMDLFWKLYFALT
jgi:GT2 family glycosyltransferase